MLDKNTLKQEIKQAFKDEQNEEHDANKSLERVATKLADAIDKFIKSGTVTVASGIAVSTAGSASAQTGTTTSIGAGTIS